MTTSARQPHVVTPSFDGLELRDINIHFPLEAVSYDTANDPHPAKLIDSLRSTGYNVFSTCNDLIDNSLQAGATEIHLHLGSDGLDGILLHLVDNGCGMAHQTLDEAMKLGTVGIERDRSSDLSQFGMGLKTAPLGICQTIDVITKTIDGPIIHSRQDVGIIKATDKFIKHLGIANETMQALFYRLLPNAAHGTVIRLSNCDRIGWKKIGSLLPLLRKEIGQTYRKFLDGNARRIFITDYNVKDEPAESKDGFVAATRKSVGGQKLIEVLPIDPLMVDFVPAGDTKAEVYADADHQLTFRDEDEQEQQGIIHVKLVLLADYSQEGNRRRKINWENQGIYLLRNQREIAAGQTFKLFTKHPDFNRIRAEVSFPGTMDNAFGVKFNKTSDTLIQALSDKLRDVLIKPMRELEKRAREQRVKVEASDISHTDSERLIKEKSKLLINPITEIEKRNRSANPESQRQTSLDDLGPADTERTRTPVVTHSKVASLPCKFETASMGRGTLPWEWRKPERTLIITWNVDHPFYERFVLENKENKSMVTASDILVYCLALAESKFYGSDDEETQEMLNTIREMVGFNLGTLLK